MAGNIARRIKLQPNSLPEERNRRALQGQHKEENETNDCGHTDDNP